MSEDLKQVYDFVCSQEDTMSALCESLKEFTSSSGYHNIQGQSQMAWNIKTFIEENFIGNSKI